MCGTSDMDDKSSYPNRILLFSGKRKSGKDFIAELMLKRLGLDNAIIIRLSAPIKSFWAKTNNLHLDELLGSGQYKENHRKAMIDWSENVRRNDYGYFCRAAVEMADVADSKSVWLVSDMRRKTDLLWFSENFPDKIIKTIRIVSSDEIRKERGWVFEKGVDDAESECDLDSVDKWDFIFNNNNVDDEFQSQFNNIIDMCK